MIDLHTHFVCHFDINDGQAPVLETWVRVNSAIRRWLYAKLPRAADACIDLNSSAFVDGTTSPLIYKDQLVEIAVEVGEGSKGVPQFWSLKYEHDQVNWSNRRWKTDVTVECFGHCLRFSMVLSHYIEGDWFGKEPNAPIYSIPRLVTELVQQGSAERDGRTLSLTCTPVKDLNAFVEFLQASDRTLPIILISKIRDGSSLLPDLNDFAKKVGALAHVFHLETSDDAFFLSDAIGNDFSTYGGALRVYQPGFGFQGDHQSRHRFFPPQLIRDLGVKVIEDSLIRGLLRSSAARLKNGITSVEQVRYKSQEQLAAFALEEDRSITVLRTQIAELGEDLSKAKSENSSLSARIKFAEEQYRNLEKELASERYKRSLLDSSELPNTTDADVDSNFSAILAKLSTTRVVCVGNSSTPNSFRRALGESLNLTDEQIAEHFEIVTIEQTSEQIEKMISRYSKRRVIYAWHGLKDATDQRKKFAGGLHQAETVRLAVERFRQWAESA